MCGHFDDVLYLFCNRKTAFVCRVSKTTGVYLNASINTQCIVLFGHPYCVYNVIDLSLQDGNNSQWHSSGYQ